MIIKGGSCGGAGRLAAHLLRADHNERVEVHELRGTAAADLPGALADLVALAAGTQCCKPLYHASLNSRADEVLTGAQRLHAVDRLEAALGLTGHPRAVVVHEKGGRDHTHVVWARADAERGRVVSDSHNYRRHEAVARELEQAFGHAPVSGVHVGRQRDGQARGPRPARTPGHAEMQQAARSATRPDQARAEVTALWRSTTTGRAFAAALSDAGWQLCRGDRRDYVLLDAAGDVHSLARQIKGARAADIRVRMADLDPATLPGVAEARDARRIAAQPEGAAAGQVVRFPRSSREAAREVTRRRDAAISAGESSGHAGGLYVTVSRQRTDYSRPLFQPSANGNSPKPWTPARIVGLGQFRALAHMTTTRDWTTVRPERVTPARPVLGTRVDRSAESGGVDHEAEALRGLLDTIADEVQARTAGLCEAIAADFAGKIRVARKSLPRDHVAAAVAALKQVKREAVKFVRETAASEIRGRQKRTRLSFQMTRRKQLCARPADFC